MIQFDHLTMPVTDHEASRDWYIEYLGFELEFMVDDPPAAAITDSNGFTIFLNKWNEDSPCAHSGMALTLQVDDVDALHAELTTKGVVFSHAPKKTFWGYGAELKDPDGHCLRIWGKTPMEEKG